jgi:hypothetical protein
MVVASELRPGGRSLTRPLPSAKLETAKGLIPFHREPH